MVLERKTAAISRLFLFLYDVAVAAQLVLVGTVEFSMLGRCVDGGGPGEHHVVQPMLGLVVDQHGHVLVAGRILGFACYGRLMMHRGHPFLRQDKSMLALINRIVWLHLIELALE